MSSIPDPPASNNRGASQATPSLEAGLAALKQGDHPTAIAHLEGVCEIELHEPTILRAQMGLVLAYEGNGQIESALALCQTLSSSPQRQVKEWAERINAGLQARYPQILPSPAPTSQPPAPPDPTGFVPSPSLPAGKKSRAPLGSAPSPPAAGKQNKPQQSPNPQIPALPIQPVNRNISWRNAGRKKDCKPLPLAKQWHFRLLLAGTLAAQFWVMRAIFQFFLATVNDILVTLRLAPIQEFYRLYYAPNPPVLAAMALLTLASPWLLDALLQRFYGAVPLSADTQAASSPEAVQVLKRFCRQKNWPVPVLKLLPTTAPVALSYGNLPRTARIAVSQGLLDRLADAEIAAICAGEIGHIATWDFAVISQATLVANIPYLIYWQVAQWGDRWPKAGSWQAKLLRSGATGISALAYGLYWLLRWPALWLSRVRVYYSDRLAAEMTGNPNGLTRALLKMAAGIAEDVQQQGKTSYLLEGFDLLVPVGHRQAGGLGSCLAGTSLESLLEWDCRNPYRRWLAVNNSHPPAGDRLQLLAQYARFWKLETELDLNKRVSAGSSESLNRKTLLLLGAPFFGMLAGLAAGCLLWLLGWIGLQFRISLISWLFRDWEWVFWGLLLVGFSLGTVVRFNSFFPEIRPSADLAAPSLPSLLAQSAALPLDSQPVRLEGQLLGRTGIGNCLGQDLLLHTASGLVKLHCFSNLGPVWLQAKSLRPWDLVSRQVTVTGWFRRGATPWIDVETLQAGAGRTCRSGHPIWSAILAGAAALWATYLLSQGGF
jgi:Zn-dependent protease with chaperone function